MEGSLGLRLWVNQWEPATLEKSFCQWGKEDVVKKEHKNKEVEGRRCRMKGSETVDTEGQGSRKEACTQSCY